MSVIRDGDAGRGGLGLTNLLGMVELLEDDGELGDKHGGHEELNSADTHLHGLGKLLEHLLLSTVAVAAVVVIVSTAVTVAGLATMGVAVRGRGSLVVVGTVISTTMAVAGLATMRMSVRGRGSGSLVVVSTSTVSVGMGIISMSVAWLTIVRMSVRFDVTHVCRSVVVYLR
jgi:hypothetical protein